MKKTVALFLALVLALTLALASAQAESGDLVGRVLPDFTAETSKGKTFTLSESLKTHDLVVINFWATWCPPCRAEFSFLQEAWEKYADRIDLIGLSIEENDTMETIGLFAKAFKLNFQLGRDETRIYNSLRTGGVPTTIIVDKDMRIVAVEVGMKTATEQFTSLFDSLLPAAL